MNGYNPEHEIEMREKIILKLSEEIKRLTESLAEVENRLSELKKQKAKK